MTASTMMNPILNNNGTSRQSLIDARMDARDWIMETMKALGETRPHGRDYQGDASRYEADLAIYSRRFAMLDQLRNELMDEAIQIRDQ